MAAKFLAAGTPADQATGDAAAVLTLERKVGEAIVRGDAAYFDSVTSPDFMMTHSDRWTTGGKPLLVDNKEAFMKRISSRSYLAHDYDSVKIEFHGDTAITYGRYVGHIEQNVPPERAWFSVWYEKVYAKRNGQWQYLSHRTVSGAHYGPDRAAVADK